VVCVTNPNQKNGGNTVLDLSQQQGAGRYRRCGWPSKDPNILVWEVSAIWINSRRRDDVIV